jgi:hypothetical protein
MIRKSLELTVDYLLEHFKTLVLNKKQETHDSHTDLWGLVLRFPLY